MIFKANDNSPPCYAVQKIDKIWRDRQESQEYLNVMRLVAWELKMMRKDIKNGNL